MEVEIIDILGKYRELIRNHFVCFSCMVFGKPKSDKSTTYIGFAKYLSEYHGKVINEKLNEATKSNLETAFLFLNAKYSQIFK